MKPDPTVLTKYKYTGRPQIKSLEIVPHHSRHEDMMALKVVLEDGRELRVYDDGQQCFEKRRLNCSEDLPGFVGSQLVSIGVREAWTNDDESNGIHEMTLVYVETTLGDIVLETHNMHNGYYSGFDLCIEESNHD